ncbi:DM13 domain-containing protein [Mycobacteroides abscessus]|uniref:DM13 domain-containing protein n=1 Tax=Mycobacteroides abscessus TaxID=36809 RepID=UPI0002F68834|nr:DM13 domain-containing protein [Mycobacteroides abscessus]ORA30380.1 hypothetical protein BST18_02350 [Mycobacteroides abscessus subsp. bolletii]TPF68791.1 hypothetical protein XW60_08295 [Mycobacteroides abscessus subsp. bolletii]SHU84531.1 Electron transfer DM13 [Mycobacteroides abscessus subsp. bolletii]SHW20278.1 Electron transfer DM13 [Mycobacteroides abscessus subsp. bolletii]SHW50561.1 Electron transfer DM13 [Mycobacteroides abscessus subsp. bolletii]
MRINPIVIAGTAVLALVVAACSDDKSPTTATSMATPPPAMSVPMTSSESAPAARSGMFQGTGDKHVTGKVTVTGSTVEFTDFSSDEGPDLHVYLTMGETEADVDSGIRVAAIKFDQASQTFPLMGADTRGYTTVVIHCDKAKAVFGAATLM